MRKYILHVNILIWLYRECRYYETKNGQNATLFLAITNALCDIAKLKAVEYHAG